MAWRRCVWRACPRRHSAGTALGCNSARRSGTAAGIAVDAAGRLVLSAGGKSFVLAARTDSYLPVDAGDPKMPEFAAEPGDSASLVIERSLLAWPTPFEINFVGL